MEVRKCRRRKQVPWRGLPIASLLTIQDEFALGMKAMVARMRALIRHKGLYLLDAFRAMDYDRNGLIDCSELWGGLTLWVWEVTPAQVYDIMQTIEPSRVGLISFDDFQRALQLRQ